MRRQYEGEKANYVKIVVVSVIEFGITKLGRGDIRFLVIASVADWKEDEEITRTHQEDSDFPNCPLVCSEKTAA